MSFLDRIRKHHAQRLHTLASAPMLPPRDQPFGSQLCTQMSEQTFLWIAEVKQASPSRGDLAPDIDPVTVARAYVNNGADMLSVLTEPHFFKGSVNTLAAIRSACPGTPLLMKDFILDTVQIAHGQAAGANAFLLIMALLSDTALETLYREGLQRGLLPLVEVHTEKEVERLAQIVKRQAIPPPALIGVNHRCLQSLKIDLSTSQRLYLPLRRYFPQARLIAESGLLQAQDVLHMQTLGYQGCLVGSAFMSHKAPGKVLQSWKAYVSQASQTSPLKVSHDAH